MGSRFDAQCLDCDQTYTARYGGGFCFDLLTCTGCGRTQEVEHHSVEAHYTGRMKAYWMSRLANPDERQREHLQHLVDTHPEVIPLSEEEYCRAVEATLQRCKCGGVFTYDAPVRCPQCRSTSNKAVGGFILYD